MTPAFTELVELAQRDPAAFREIPRSDCLAAARTFAAEQRGAIRRRHEEGESGLNVLRMLSATADTLLRGVIDFGMSQATNRRLLMSRVSLCALGGYGRMELSPYSDLDVCLVYDTTLDAEIKSLNSYILYFLWDLGFEVGYSVRSITETVDLAKTDLKAFTCLLESRLIAGDNTHFARIKMHLRELMANGAISRAYISSRIRSRYEDIPEAHSDLYHFEPDIKEQKGGLRDFHTALWLLMMVFGPMTLDDVVSLNVVTEEEYLAIIQALNLIWRVRNELHFHSGREDDELSYANQRHVAQAFGYGKGEGGNVNRFMQDYFASARQLRRFLRIATQVCDQQRMPPPMDTSLLPARTHIVVKDGQVFAGVDDANWFAEQPPRLMEVFWECARHRAPLSRATERRMAENMDLVNDAFRSNDLVRRFFLAICNRAMTAGFALRQAARTGLLGRYLPEFAAVQGIIRYEDFHHFPVDEHTLRALEALASLPEMEGPVAGCLHMALEHLPDTYILVLAILCHDLGKVEGEVHVEQGAAITEQICARIGIGPDDTERIVFLVRNHMVMTRISQYRDIDDIDIVQDFAKAMKTEERLRSLFLLSYADMAAVGPGVWNEWKGALLMRLYLKTEKMLLGRVEVVGEEFWRSPKADEVRAIVDDDLKGEVESHIQGLGERYLSAFSPKYIAIHMRCVAQARETGLAVNCTTHQETDMTEVVVCTADRHGLFSNIAGTFASQLADVNNAALFTRPDGIVVDCFTVADASRNRPLTPAQCRALEKVLRAVLVDGKDVKAFVEQSKKRLFALLQPRVPVYTRITYDNTSSRSHTVVDIETGDRTGLLYDITRALADLGLDIATARIVTDARRVRDSFYVTLDGQKVEDEETQARIREALHNAIHPRAVTDDRGGS